MKRTVKLVALLLCVLCALSLAGCKNAAEDSGSGDSGGSTPTPPAGFQIKDAATFKAFASNSESYGVVVESFTLTEKIDFTTATCDKTVDLWGQTITCNNGGIDASSSTRSLTLCDTNTVKGTITGDGFLVPATPSLYFLVAFNNGSVKDGINVTMNRDANLQTYAVAFSNSATEVNSNVSVTNNGASSGTMVVAIGSGNNIGSITGGSYTATSKDGSAMAIFPGNEVTKISAGKFKATTTSGEAYGIYTSTGDVKEISGGVEFTAVGPSGKIHNKIGAKTSGYSAGVTFNPSLGT